jgi:hypothetical protein
MDHGEVIGLGDNESYKTVFNFAKDNIEYNFA